MMTEHKQQAPVSPPEGETGTPADPQVDVAVAVETVESAEAAPTDVVEESAADEAERLRAALAEAERLRDEYLDQAQRGRAEYQNLRRRTDEALSGALDRGAERLITQLFGVLDNFGYVVDALDEPGDEAESQLAKGVRMVYGELFAALEAAGLEPIPGEGAMFDPEVHEALLSEETDEPLEEPVVTEVLRRGYRFKGKTLRPASVKVKR